MPHNQEFTFTRTNEGDTAFFTIKGSINEQVDLHEVFKNLDGMKRLAVNLRGITYINSCGVRDWISVFKSLSSGLRIEFHECSEPIIEQMNMIMNFLSSGKLMSFLAPYHCDACEKEQHIIIDIARARDAWRLDNEYIAPQAPCPDCGKSMDISTEIDEDYFLFLEEST
jgi:hypothetical protein